MNIDELTIGEAKQLDSLLGGRQNECPFTPGSAYLIRTVTHYWVGRVDKVVGDFLVLGDASWVADTGRYGEATTADALNEVEPTGRAIVGLGSIVDARDWAGSLPTDAK